MTVRALVLTGFGINCEAETAVAFERAGAQARLVHLNDLIAKPEMLCDYRIMAVPGGFSFGDDVASGKIFANRLRFRLGSAVEEFVAEGKLVIGICNGYQVLVKMGLLPKLNGGLRQDVTLTYNDSGRFEDRWVHLRKPNGTRCVWLRRVEQLELPVRHGEGKFIPRDDAALRVMVERGQIALRYVRSDGAPAGGKFPANPNGSIDDVAGICDVTGRVFGLMPHPEAYIERTQHPRWTRELLPEEGAGLQIFRDGVEFAAELGTVAESRRYVGA